MDLNTFVFIISGEYSYSIVNYRHFLTYNFLCPGEAENVNMTLEPETEAIMKWSHDYNFVMSIGLRAQSMLITIPYNKPDLCKLSW